MHHPDGGKYQVSFLTLHRFKQCLEDTVGAAVVLGSGVKIL